MNNLSSGEPLQNKEGYESMSYTVEPHMKQAFFQEHVSSDQSFFRFHQPGSTPFVVQVTKGDGDRYEETVVSLRTRTMEHCQGLSFHQVIIERKTVYDLEENGPLPQANASWTIEFIACGTIKAIRYLMRSNQKATG